MGACVTLLGQLDWARISASLQNGLEPTARCVIVPMVMTRAPQLMKLTVRESEHKIPSTMGQREISVKWIAQIAASATTTQACVDALKDLLVRTVVLSILTWSIH